MKQITFVFLFFATLFSGAVNAAGIPEANFFQNASYESIQNGYLFNGVNPANRAPGMWMGDANIGEKWKLMSDGTIRRASQSNKCLQPNRYHLEVMVKRYDWKSFGLDLVDCDNSGLQRGWKFIPVTFRTVAIRHEMWPAGCLMFSMDDDGNVFPLFQMDICWLPGMEGVNSSYALYGQWIIR
jgi:hypothetical protein